MPVTLDLFELPPIARKSDPETSRRAAVIHTESGERARDLRVMLRLVRVYPGLTAAEYSVVLHDSGMDFYKAARMPTKRLSDLLNAGKVRKADPRTCRKTGRPAAVYFVE